MRLKAPFYRFALALIGFLLPSVVFAAVLPSLINAEPVKQRFIEELQSWTGANVELRGPVAIESFFSLSFNAQNVEFKGFQGLKSLKTVNAGRVVARIAWMDLFVGNLDFDKIKIYDAAIHLGAVDRDKAIGVVQTMLTEPQETPFAAFVLDDCRVLIDGGGDHSAQEISIGSIVVNLDQESQRIDMDGRFTLNGQEIGLEFVTRTMTPTPGKRSVPISLSVDSPLLTARFDGEADLSKDWHAQGSLRLRTSRSDQLTRWLGDPFEIALPKALRLAGSLDVSKKRISLISGQFSAGATNGSGDLSVTMASPEAKIDGSLAFETLDLKELWLLETSGKQQVATAEPPLLSLLRRTDIDLRVSAKRMSWAQLAMDQAAFTLTGRGGALSAEIAQLDILDGSILGHIEADLGGDSPNLRTRLSAINLDAAQLMALTAHPDWIAGRLDANLEAEAGGVDAEQMLKSATGNARVSFPDGGQLRLDLAQLAQSASSQDYQGWENVDLSWWDFSDMRFKLSYSNDRLHCADLSLQSGGETVEGNGEIDLDRQLLDWRLIVKQSAPSSSWLAQAPEAGAGAETKLSISGPWARPLIQSGKKSSRAADEQNVQPEASLADNRL